MPRPWNRHNWHGDFISLDGTSTEDFTEADVKAEFYGETNPSDWEGDCAGIALLKDGRFIVWETFWGPTGNGFIEDAYGGGADIGFASTLETAKTFLSDNGRSLLGF